MRMVATAAAITTRIRSVFFVCIVLTAIFSSQFSVLGSRLSAVSYQFSVLDSGFQYQRTRVGTKVLKVTKSALTTCVTSVDEGHRRVGLALGETEATTSPPPAVHADFDFTTPVLATNISIGPG